MPINLGLELSDEDLSYFARVMDSIWKENAKRRQFLDRIERRCDRLFSRTGMDGFTHPILRYTY